jgi:membrane fusion protein, multidrug efflux system
MTFSRQLLATALLAGALGALGALGASASEPPGRAPASGGTLAAFTPAPAEVGALVAFDGVVEALRRTTVASQVSGAVVELRVKAGDRVAAGQVLMRLDARSADQSAAATDAQVRAAEASREVAAKEWARQKQLAAERFISAAALDRAEAEYKAAQAQAAAQVAQAGAARTAVGFFVVRAPYAGVVSDVPVTLGDMAMPGRPLVTLHDPQALRVTASVPQSAAAVVGDGAAVRAQIAGTAAGAAPPMLTPRRVQILPAADAATHTVTIRADLAPGLAGAVPGQFARLWLPAMPGARTQGLWVPLQAVVRRAEMTGLYVLDAQGRPLLRQVRLGRSDGERVEILAGLSAQERIASDAQAAARVTVSAR